MKRALKEAFWSLDDKLPRGHDFVLVARPDLASLVERDGPCGAMAALGEVAAEAGLTGGTV